MMKKEFRIVYGCAIVLAGMLLSGSFPAGALVLTATPAYAATAALSAAASSKDACLTCHGPFDKLISATANYMMSSGDVKIKSTPHRYVPHDSKDIPECSKCHKPHVVPLISKEGLPEPTADYCYTCHHAGVLECHTCHW